MHRASGPSLWGFCCIIARCVRRAVMYLLEKECNPRETDEDGLTIAFWAMVPRLDILRAISETWRVKPSDKDTAAYDRIARACRDYAATEIWAWGVEVGMCLRRGFACGFGRRRAFTQRQSFVDWRPLSA